MRIKEIYIENLFGMFTYKIPFYIDERITIIHGPNGYGKTSILKMIDAIFNSREYFLFKIPFKTFTIIFDDNTSIKVEKEESVKSTEEGVDFEQVLLEFSIPNSKKKPFQIEFSPMKWDHSIKRRILRRSGYYPTDQSKDLWLSGFTEEVLPFNEILQKNGLKLFSDSFKDEREDWYIELTNQFNVLFIETQRLIIEEKIGREVSRSYRLKPAVLLYSENLRNLIQKKLAEYAEMSQALDRTFPARLVKDKPPPKFNEEETRGQLNYLEEKRKNLMSAGLLDQDIESSIVADLDGRVIEKSTIDVLNVYIVDTDKKLAIFDELYLKINLFIKIINERFLNKKLRINKQEGFVVTTKDGRKLSLEDLSSGEKHEIILLYEMLFNANPNCLILIDEPEISFHVEWQEVFLDNLLDIVKLSNLDILIATHSPQIINDKWELTVQLEGL